MNRENIAEYIAKDVRVSKKIAMMMLKALDKAVAEGLKNEGAAVLFPLGKFEKYVRKARIATIPITKEKKEIPAKNAVRFTPGKILRDAISEQ